MQKLKDFIVEDDIIFHKCLDYSIEKDGITYDVHFNGDSDRWFNGLEQAIEYVLKQVEESGK